MRTPNRLLGIRLALALALPSLILTCTRSSPVATGDGGSGTNTGNARVVAAVYTARGEPAAGAVVRMRRADYLVALPADFMTKGRVSLADTRTDEQGRFAIDGVDTGSYCIEVVGGTRAAFFRCTVTVATERLELPGDTLEPTGTLSGTVPLSAARTYDSWVQVYGLERAVRVDSSTGRFTITALPPSSYALRVSTTMPLHAPAHLSALKVAGDSVTAAGAVRFRIEGTEDYSRWAHSRRIYLNTAPSGADVADEVIGFPVCIRLDTSRFDFSQAQPGGVDLRFSRDGRALSYQIELWDDSAAQAAVWVRLDTVAGHDADQFITMHWGNPRAPDLGDGAAVFDTRDGFAGVWHLGGDYRDATINANHGEGRVSAARTRGVSGRGQAFDGVDDHIACGNGPGLAFSGRLTISAWVRLADPAIDRYYRILSKKNPWDGPTGYELECNPVHEGGYLTLIGRDNTIARAIIGWDSTWHYCVATFDGDSGKVYRDGIHRSVAWRKISSMLPGDNPLVIGGIGPDNYFFGEIDEVRVSAVVRTPAWIRLCQANQNPYGQTLVEFR
jgi:hypothetical protein